MTTLNKEPASQLGKRLQSYRADRPDEWTMDEFTRMAEELNDQLTDLKATQDKVRADAVRELLERLEHDCNGWAKDEYGNIYWHDKHILRVADEMERGE